MKLKIDDYILTKKFGFGRILTFDSNTVRVVFNDGSIRTLIKDNEGRFYKLVPNQDLLVIKEMLETISFDNNVILRSSEYANMNHFIDFNYNETSHIIVATCKGTKEYRLTLNLINKTISCSCPCNFNCKHEYALLKLLNDQLMVDETYHDEDEMFFASTNSQDNVKDSQTLDETLKKVTESFIENYLNINDALTLFKYLQKVNSPLLIKQYVSEYFNLTFQDPLVLEGLLDLLMLANPGLDYYQVVALNINNKENALVLQNEEDKIEKSSYFKKTTTDISTQYFTYECIILSRFNKLFSSLNDNPRLLNSSFYQKYLIKILRYCYNHGKSLDEAFKAMLKASPSANLDKYIEETYQYLTPKEKDNIFMFIPDRLYDILDINDLLEQIKYTYRSEKIMRVLLQKINGLNEAEKISTYLKICKVLLNRLYSDVSRHHLTNFIKYLPYNEVLDAYINNYPYNINSVKKFKLDDLDYENDVKLSDDNFTKYFKVKAEVKFIDTGYDISYFELYILKDINNNSLIELKISDDNEYAEIICNNVDVKGSFRYAKFLIAYANLYLTDFINNKKNILTKLEKLKQEKQDNLILDMFKEASLNNIERVSKQLSNNNLVSLEYHLTSYQGDSNFLLSFKVGLTRKYVVTNIRNFIFNFRLKREASYGKGLTFLHILNNIEPCSRNLISYLCSIDLDNCENKYLNLNPYQLDAVFLNIKDQFVYYNEEPYQVRLNPISCLIKLDESYNLSLIGLENYHLFETEENIYLFNDETKTIDILKQDESNISLIKTLIKHNNVDISRVKKQFLEQIYPVFEDSIEVDDSLKNEFKSSLISIQSYFDLNNNGEILLETKFLKNGNEVKENQIFATADIGKLNKYKSMIKELGFINNCLTGQDLVLAFLGMDFTYFKKVSEVYLSESLANKKLVTFTPPTIRLGMKNNMMEVFMGSDEFDVEELRNIMAALRAKRKFVLLKNDHIVNLDSKEAEEFFATVEDLGLDEKHLLDVQTKPIYQTLAAFSHLSGIELDEKLSQMVDDIKNFKKAKYKLPKLNAKLRSYQKEGYNWLKILTHYGLGGILADDMGLGKTLETIALITSDVNQAPSLIVAPKSLVFNWVAEFDKFAPDIETKIIYGTSTDRKNILENIDLNKKVIYLTSYDSLRNDVDLYQDTFDYLILDEAQYIKNVHALKTVSIKQIKANHRFALTGTPIENDVFDLWSIFDFLMPGYLPKLSRLKSNANNSDYLDLVARRVAPFILRRTKQDVLKDLPPKFERVISAEMSTNQRKIYEAFCLEARTMLKNSKTQFAVLQFLTRLRQICVDPKTFDPSFEGKSGKTELIKSLIKEYIANNHRILIFSQFVTALNILEKFLKKEHIKYHLITGATSGKDRVKFVDEFNNDETIKVFLISLKAGGNGLNLIGADTVIHFDPWWNLAAENQATDRAYRIGQTKNVEVIKLIASDSIEQRVIELQYKKKDLIDKLISDDTSALEKISFDDLNFILN